MNVRLLAGIAFVLCSAPAPAQTEAAQCIKDAGGNRTCIRTQADTNVCGYAISFIRGPGRPTLPCNDVVVEKFAPDGRQIYQRVLDGESEDAPRYLYLDDRGNAVVLGTTWSAKYPVTPDAAQRSYAGPAPSLPGSGRLDAGGDLFVTALSASGNIVYSTFLGSPENDSILSADNSVRGRADILVWTTSLRFPADYLPASGGPVLVGLDLATRKVVRSRYLQVAEAGQPAHYTAIWKEDGTVFAATPATAFRFLRDGTLYTRVDLRFPYLTTPLPAEDSSGDVWLTGNTASEAQIVRLTRQGSVEAFRWTVPSYGSAPTISTPFFGPNGLVYVGGVLGYRGGLKSVTKNAILRQPCADWSGSWVAVMERDGDVRMLSYFPGLPSFTIEKNRSVSAAAGAATPGRISLDLGQGPKIGCVFDALRSFSSEPLAVGQLARIRGAGFGGRTLAASALSGKFSSRLDGIRVRIDEIDAPILAASEGEAIVSIPYGIRHDGIVPVTVQDGSDRSDEFLVQVSVLVPKLLSSIYNQDGTPNTQSTPAPWGSAVSFYLTGTGPYSPSLADGQVAGPEGTRRIEAHVEAAYQVQGPAEEAGTVLYAGPVPGLFGGVSRIVVRLPQARPFGYSSIVLFLKIGTVRFPLPSIWVR